MTSPDSCWVNPTINGAGDREKPEVVAPGTLITAITRNASLLERGGTSLSAPRVTGLAALLIDRNWSLTSWPEASRAIIIASAIHNIEGHLTMPTGLDVRDGAGGINAAVADMVARHRAYTSSCTAGSCWWGIALNTATFTSLLRPFEARSGDRIRVAIAWWAKAYCPSQSNCSLRFHRA